MKIPALTLAALLLGVATANAQQAVDRTVPSSATGSVSVYNLAGKVTVTGWNRSEIRVTGRLGRGTERLDVTGSGSDTEIRVVIPRNAHNVQDSELEIHVPVGKDVTVRGTSADVEVGGVTGEVDARSTSGDVQVSGSPASVDAGSTSGDVAVHASTRSIRAHSVSGDVQVSGSARESVSAESVSGDVTVSAPTQDMMVKSVSGDLEVTGVSRRLTASTVSGDARVRGSDLQYGSFQTVSGNLRYEGSLRRDAAFNVQSHSGDVTLVLPADVKAEFQVKTFSGDVENEFGPEAHRVSRYTPGSELRFSTGQGGMVNIKTFSGTVELLRR